MSAKQLKNGDYLVPATAVGPNGVMGDGMVRVKKGTKEHKAWAPHVSGATPARPKKPATKKPAARKSK